MIAISYTVTLHEPLLATALSGDPNSAVSSPYIPGSMVRGMLIARHGTPNDLVTSARQLFFSGQVCYLHAYPAHPTRRDNIRSLPLPASWRKEKKRTEKQGLIEDWAQLDKADSDLKDPAAVSGDFVWLNDDNTTLYTPPTQITVHTQRDRGPGRARRGEGAVYRYEALAAGEKFAGVILCNNEALAMQVKALLKTGTSYLGGAQTAGYGRVTLEAAVGTTENNTAWCEYAGDVKTMTVGERLVITLLSDAILRDENGATHTDLLAALDLSLELKEAFKQVTPVGGFNRKWGLPLPQTQALGAGSVFVCQTTNIVTEAHLEKWLQRGVGERRVEGFGRLAFNWQPKETLNQREIPPHNYAHSDLKLPTEADDPVRQLAQRMVVRRQRHALDQALIKAVYRLEIKAPPPNSQLSSVRVIARHALQAGKLERISNLFKRAHPNAIKNRSLQKFERARIGEGQRLSDWIQEVVEHPEQIWQKYFTHGQGAKELGEVKPGQDLAIEYAVRLIDSVLARATTEKRRKPQNKHGGDTNGAA